MRYSQLDAKNIWDKIPKKCKHGVKTAPRDFVALECLANDSLYAKPDSMKMFLLWEVKRNGVKIETSPNLSSKHPWVYKLFIQSQFVRFPFNTWDTEIGDSLSWATVRQNLLPNNFHERFSILPRWSTASRSSLALIPENANKLPVIVPGAVDLGERKRLQNNAYVNVPEWKDCETKRFCSVVGQVGDAAGKMGIRLQPYSENSACRYRLYSIKTGVTYVGSKNEGGFGKNRLEANCSMAMLRSKVIDSLPNKDNTFGVQTEILTITAPLAAGGQDGFQVRDLSCMWKTLSYVPCQSIPYAREGVDHAASNKAQSDFWRSTFGIHLGRAKARLFLNYGLVHTSANAQNFILGFYGHARFTGSLRQFVARDVGDTSWHDAYIKKYFRITAFGKKVYSAYQQEKGSVIRHILHETSSGDYPPPHMVRLAAYSVLTHDFGKNLNEKSQWNNAHIYSLATGILDGFRDYIEEAFGFKSLYPQNPTLLDDDYIKRIGYYAKYPASKAYLSEYKKTVDELLKESAATLFNKAAAVRVRGIAAVKNAQQAKFADHGSSGISGLINAEEALLCAGIEVHLGIVPSELAKVEIRNKLDNLIKGNWPNIVNW